MKTDEQKLNIVGAAVTSVIFRALAQRGKREANSPKDAA